MPRPFVRLVGAFLRFAGDPFACFAALFVGPDLARQRGAQVLFRAHLEIERKPHGAGELGEA